MLFHEQKFFHQKIVIPRKDSTRSPGHMFRSSTVFRRRRNSKQLTAYRGQNLSRLLIIFSGVMKVIVEIIFVLSSLFIRVRVTCFKSLQIFIKSKVRLGNPTVAGDSYLNTTLK